jgi:hypothetical protein
MSNNSSSRKVGRGEKKTTHSRPGLHRGSYTNNTPPSTQTVRLTVACGGAANCCETGSHCQLRKVPKKLIIAFSRNSIGSSPLEYGCNETNFRLGNSVGSGKDSTRPQLPNADLGGSGSFRNELIGISSDSAGSLRTIRDAKCVQFAKCSLASQGGLGASTLTGVLGTI